MWAMYMIFLLKRLMRGFSDCAAWMMQALGIKVGGVGLLGGVEGSKVFALANCSDSRHPTPAMLANSKNSALVAALRTSLILSVFAVRRFAQVTKAIVFFVAVDVVYLVYWPDSMHPKPCKTVGVVLFPINRDMPVFFAIQTSGNRAGLEASSVAMRNPSRKNAGQRIVIKKLAQAISRQWNRIGFAHLSLPFNDSLGSGASDVRVRGVAHCRA